MRQCVLSCFSCGDDECELCLVLPREAFGKDWMMWDWCLLLRMVWMDLLDHISLESHDLADLVVDG